MLLDVYQIVFVVNIYFNRGGKEKQVDSICSTSRKRKTRQNWIVSSNCIEKNYYLLSGGVQYLLDIAIFAILVIFFGNYLSINYASRFIAGSAGFYINGYIVFKTLNTQSPKQKRISAIQFFGLWLVMTAISSLLLSFFTQQTQSYYVVIKGIVELMLAMASFFVQKYVVYQSRKQK